MAPEDLAAMDWTADGATHDGRRYHQIGSCGPSRQVGEHEWADSQPRIVCDTLSRDASIGTEEDEALSALLAAAPKLAVACLKAHAFVARVCVVFRVPDFDGLEAALWDALEAADLRVPEE
jgi:hypothetical protein